MTAVVAACYCQRRHLAVGPFSLPPTSPSVKHPGASRSSVPLRGLPTPGRPRFAPQVHCARQSAGSGGAGLPTAEGAR
eukprot:10785300-Alexandrium_andersonii.AAC.1